MGYGFAYDPPPSVCAKGPRPGAKALRDGVKASFPVTDLGIFNCRPVRVKGATVLSFHADGRAVDFGCKGEVNRLLCLALVANAETLGIQEVIGTGRRRWDSRSREWHHYAGDDPHDTHVHVALCTRAADTLTLATVKSVLGEHQEEDDMAQVPQAEWDNAKTAIRLMHESLGRVEAMVAAGKGVSAADIAAAIPAELAEQVADELAERLKA